VPDYYAKFPKACMGGWGRKLMLIVPSGDVLPCHAARIIHGLTFDNVKDRGLREIWENSAAFQKFRGEDWMQEPCRSCDRREVDFGGCRCQAMLLVNDAAATDPVCSLSPNRNKVDAILAELALKPAETIYEESKPAWIYRINPA
jgi:pyrroloquinoline quinone biosynthesis protein E